VLLFLACEVTGTPTTADVAEVVAKIVRELGHPALARAFTEGGKRAHRKPEAAPAMADFLLRLAPLDAPSAVGKKCLSEYSLHIVFSRDLAAAHRDGLVTLTGLEGPLDLAACVLRPRGDDLLEALIEARGLTSGWVAVDGPEYWLNGETTAQQFV